MSSGYLPKMAKLETKAVIRMYLPSCSLDSGSTNMVFSVLKDWTQMPCQWGTGLQRENWSHELPGCYCKKRASLFHCNILCLIFFLPEWFAQMGRTQGTQILASPCVYSYYEKFSFPLGFAAEILPHVRDSQVQILPKELSLEDGSSYSVFNT